MRWKSNNNSDWFSVKTLLHECSLTTLIDWLVYYAVSAIFRPHNVRRCTVWYNTKAYLTGFERKHFSEVKRL